MAHLIDKDALIAEIENRIKSITEKAKGSRTPQFTLFGKINALEDLSLYINTLEVKEVDLEKEIDKFYGMYRDKNGVTHDMQDNEICLDWKEDCNYHFKIDFAKHFFELGLKTKQE